MTGRCVVVVGFVLGALAPARAEPLPVVADADPAALRDSVTRVLVALEQAKAPLPPEATQSLRKLLATPGAKPAAVQELLDPFCLIGVSINPESRVKAARGPAPAELRRGQERFVLVKVHNEAGVTHGLAVSGTDGTGLHVKIATPKPLRPTLSGSTVEYVLLSLKAAEAGKREATLKFDVGQGTQDLGFRAEVPILFTVKP